MNVEVKLIKIGVNDAEKLWKMQVKAFQGCGRIKIPYYGTAWSNIASKRVAINAGYKPVCVEMKAKKI